MAEASMSAERKSGTQADAGSSEITRQGPLQTERGQTTIADAVVTKVASEATREVRGVHELGGGVSRAIGSVTQRVGVGDERTQGVSVEVGEREAAVDVTLVVDYGESIPRVSQAVRDNVTAGEGLSANAHETVKKHVVGDKKLDPAEKKKFMDSLKKGAKTPHAEFDKLHDKFSKSQSADKK